VDAISFRPASHTHEISALRQIDDFVSINSAVEVDLFGQVNAEIVGTRQYSGTGGSVDFMRGAAASKRGRSVVALLATAREGQVSRIVPALERGVAATAARTDVDYIVTEYGVVRLFGMDLDARAQALIGIAAPAFRDRLREQWQQLRKAG
jgi:4-hydroxybutyrate CoA-transferase